MFLKKLMNRDKKEETPIQDANEEQLAKDEEEAVKGEKNLKRILETARKLYTEKKIVGSIDIARSFVIYTTSLSCEIDGTETNDEDPLEPPAEDEDGEKLTRFEKMAMSSITKAINTLEHRAKVYKNRPYKKDLSLSTGIYVTDPFLGISTLSVSCSATVSSLLALSENKKIE